MQKEFGVYIASVNDKKNSRPSVWSSIALTPRVKGLNHLVVVLAVGARENSAVKV